jgi:hypothetical protein
MSKELCSNCEHENLCTLKFERNGNPCVHYKKEKEETKK